MLAAVIVQQHIQKAKDELSLPPPGTKLYS